MAKAFIIQCVMVQWSQIYRATVDLEANCCLHIRALYGTVFAKTCFSMRLKQMQQEIIWNVPGVIFNLLDLESENLDVCCHFLPLRFGASISYLQGRDDNSNGNNSKKDGNCLFQGRVKPSELKSMRIFFNEKVIESHITFKTSGGMMI